MGHGMSRGLKKDGGSGCGKTCGFRIWNICGCAVKGLSGALSPLRVVIMIEATGHKGDPSEGDIHCVMSHAICHRHIDWHDLQLRGVGGGGALGLKGWWCPLTLVFGVTCICQSRSCPSGVGEDKRIVECQSTAHNCSITAGMASTPAPSGTCSHPRVWEM